MDERQELVERRQKKAYERRKIVERRQKINGRGD
jgi:hypothetical protein